MSAGMCALCQCRHKPFPAAASSSSLGSLWNVNVNHVGRRNMPEGTGRIYTEGYTGSIFSEIKWKNTYLFFIFLFDTKEFSSCFLKVSWEGICPGRHSSTVVGGEKVFYVWRFLEEASSKGDGGEFGLSLIIQQGWWLGHGGELLNAVIWLNRLLLL